jgi:hypothetical protein
MFLSHLCLLSSKDIHVDDIGQDIMLLDSTAELAFVFSFVRCWLRIAGKL